MKMAHITPSSDTNWNIILGLASRGDMREFKQFFETANIEFNEEYFIEVVTKLGLSDCEDLIKMVNCEINLWSYI